MSRSNASSCVFSHSGIVGTVTEMPVSRVVQAAEQGVLPDRGVALEIDVLTSTASSAMVAKARRWWPSESKAPALISESSTRLLHTWAGTFSRKSVKSV